MKKNILWIAAGALLQLLYTVIACRYWWAGLTREAVGLGGCGWIGSLLLVFGGMRGVILDELEDMVDEAEKFFEQGRAWAERARELADAIEEEVKKRGVLSHPLAMCPKCGGTIWMEIGGRMECIRCGEPLPANGVEEER